MHTVCNRIVQSSDATAVQSICMRCVVSIRLARMCLRRLARNVSIALCNHDEPKQFIHALITSSNWDVLQPIEQLCSFCLSHFQLLKLQVIKNWRQGRHGNEAIILHASPNSKVYAFTACVLLCMALTLSYTKSMLWMKICNTTYIPADVHYWLNRWCSVKVQRLHAALEIESIPSMNFMCHPHNLQACMTEIWLRQHNEGSV